MIQKECEENFDTMIRAAKNNDVCVVSCTDAKGRSFQTLCVLAIKENGEYIYLPFGFMLTPSLYSLMGKINPPENLKGEWMWDEK
mgnify:CR=1 FL=1